MVPFIKPLSIIKKKCVCKGGEVGFKFYTPLTWKILVTMMVCSVFIENLEGQY